MTRGFAALALGLALIFFAGRAGADEKTATAPAPACSTCTKCVSSNPPAPCGACQRSLLQKLRDWLCYRPLPVPCECLGWGNKGIVCDPPLYTFFLHQKVNCTPTAPGAGTCNCPGR